MSFLIPRFSAPLVTAPEPPLNCVDPRTPPATADKRMLNEAHGAIQVGC